MLIGLIEINFPGRPEFIKAAQLCPKLSRRLGPTSVLVGMGPMDLGSRKFLQIEELAAKCNLLIFLDSKFGLVLLAHALCDEFHASWRTENPLGFR